MEIQSVAAVSVRNVSTALRPTSASKRTLVVVKRTAHASNFLGIRFFNGIIRSAQSGQYLVTK